MKKNYFAIALITMISLLATACGNKENTIYPVKIGDNWGYVTEKGKYVVNPSFESAGFFHCGRARIVKEGKVGYIDTKGKIVIAPIYEDGSDFSENKAMVVMAGDIPQCINTSGKVIFTAPSWAERVYSFVEGNAKVKTLDDKITFLDANGKEVLPNPVDGLAYNDRLFWLIDTSGTKSCYSVMDLKGNKQFGVDPDIMHPYYRNQSQNSSFSEGLAAMKGHNGKYGYIDAKGIIRIDFQFEEANNFSEGLALVKTGKQYGYINKKGEFVINPQFVDARSFHEGMAAVEQNHLWGFINTSGKLVVTPVYESACDYLGGNALVRKEHKLGIIDRKGKMVVTPQFEAAWKTIEGSQDISVLSMKYTGTAFIPAFLSRHKEGSWDGMNSATTLGEIRSKYKTAKANGDFQFVCETSFEPLDGITLSSMTFLFNDITYKLVDKYVQGWFFTYKSGKKRQYKNSIQLGTLEYTMSFDKSTKHKAYSFAEALAEGMAQELGAEIVIDSNDDSHCFTLVKNEDEIVGVMFDKTESKVYAAIKMN